MRISLIAVLVALLLVAGLGADVLGLKETGKDDSYLGELVRLLGPAAGDFSTQPQPQEWKRPSLGPEVRVTEFLPNGDFEDGPSQWTEVSLNGWDLILNAIDLPVAPHSVNWAVWLGGDFDEIAYVEQRVKVPDSSPEFKYWHWIASEDICGYDFGGVVVNSSIVIDVYNLCDDNDTNGWVLHSVNLAAYAGQTIDIQIRAETDGSLNSNLFVDDVFFEFDAPVGGLFSDGFEFGDTSAWSSTVE